MTRNTIIWRSGWGRLLFLLTVLLFPIGFPDGASFRDYFYSRRRRFFGLLLAVTAVDVVDSLAKQAGYLESLGFDYWITVTVQSLLCIVAVAWSDRRFHGLLAVSATLFLLAWASGMYGAVQ